MKRIIGNAEMVEMFGTDANKRNYDKNKKVPSKTKAQLIRNGSPDYDIIDLGRGKYEIEKRDKPLTKSEYRSMFKKNGRKFECNQYDVEYINDISKGIYKIQHNNRIYIGSTTDTFRKRFGGYFRNEKNSRTSGNELYDDGGVFSTLEIMNDSSVDEIRKREFEYIENYLNNPDYEVVNKVLGITDFKNIKIHKSEFNIALKILKDNGVNIYNKINIEELC